MAAIVRAGVLLSAALLLAGPAAAGSSPFAATAAVGDAALERVRGGFTSPDSGLHVTFGVQRAVYVDGQPTVATALPAGGSLLLVVQRGDGNDVVGAGLAPATAAATTTTIVQNTLDNQKLQVVTTIDVQTDGLRVSRRLALQATVGLGIAASLRR